MIAIAFVLCKLSGVEILTKKELKGLKREILDLLTSSHPNVLEPVFAADENGKGNSRKALVYVNGRAGASFALKGQKLLLWRIPMSCVFIYSLPI